MLQHFDVQRLQKPRAARWYEDHVNVCRASGSQDISSDVRRMAVQSEYYVNIAAEISHLLRYGFEPHLHDVGTVVPGSQVPHF